MPGFDPLIGSLYSHTHLAGEVIDLPNKFVNVTGDTMTGDLEITSGGFTVSHPDSGDTLVIGENAYSYNNVGGKGTRNSFITSTDSGNVWYTASMGGYRIVDGVYDNYQYYNNGQAISGATWFKFDFGVGNSPVITECKVVANAAAPTGVWKWQGSSNDTDWVDIGSSFTLGTQNPDFHTQMNGNTTGYRYYRLLGVSGTISWAALIYEWEFKIDTSLGSKSVVNFPDLVGFGVSDPEAQIDIKAISDEAGDWVQRVKSINNVQFFGVRNDGRVAYGVRNDTPTYPVDIAGEALVTGVAFIDPLATLTNATITQVGTPGTTTYTYKVVPMVGGRRGGSSVFTTTTGNATLNGTNYNRITFAHIKGATSYELRRVSGGSSTGWIYTGYPTMAGDIYIDDKGVTGDGTDNAYYANRGTGWLALGGQFTTYKPIAQFQTTLNSPVQVTGTHTNSEFSSLAISYYGTFQLDNTYLPDWSRVGGIFIGGSPSGGSGRNGVGIYSHGRGGYLGAIGIYAVGEAVNNVPAYALKAKVISYTGNIGYGLYIDSVGGAGTNYAIFTNDGSVVLNESGSASADVRIEGDTATNLIFVDASADSVQIGTTTAGALANFTPTEININDGGSATIDFRVESDAYNALFVDASNDSIAVMNNASGKVGFFGATPVTKQTELTDELTTITHTAPGTPDYAVQDLTDSSAGATFGFATKDEGNTVLSVIANLQTRVNELETKLTNYGLLIDVD